MQSELRAMTAQSSISRAFLLVADSPNTDGERSYWGLQRWATFEFWQSAIEGSPLHNIMARQVASSIGDDKWSYFLSTVESARKLQAEYRQAGVSFDLLDVRPCERQTEGDEESTRPGFLGFDVSTPSLRSVIYEELLSLGPDDATLNDLAPVFRVASLYFTPRLNQWGLFASFSDALLFRDMLGVLEAIAPACFVPEWGELFIFSLTVLGPIDGPGTAAACQSVGPQCL